MLFTVNAVSFISDMDRELVLELDHTELLSRAGDCVELDVFNWLNLDCKPETSRPVEDSFAVVSRESDPIPRSGTDTPDRPSLSTAPRLRYSAGSAVGLVDEFCSKFWLLVFGEAVPCLGGSLGGRLGLTLLAGLPIAVTGDVVGTSVTFLAGGFGKRDVSRPVVSATNGPAGLLSSSSRESAAGSLRLAVYPGASSSLEGDV